MILSFVSGTQVQFSQLHQEFLIMCWFANILYLLHIQIVATHHLKWFNFPSCDAYETACETAFFCWLFFVLFLFFFYNFNLFVFSNCIYCRLLFHVRHIGQKCRTIKEHKLDECRTWKRIYKKTLSQVLSPKSVVWLFVDRRRYCW